MSIDINKYVDVSSERKSFFLEPHAKPSCGYLFPQLSYCPGTFLDTWYSKAALVKC